MKRGSQAISPEQVAALDARGMSASEIAVALGCTVRSVTRWRARLRGEPGPVFAPVPVEVLEQAERLFDDGASQAEVSRTLGINRKTLQRHFPGRGWTGEDAGEWGLFLRRPGMAQLWAEINERKAS